MIDVEALLAMPTIATSLGVVIRFLNQLLKLIQEPDDHTERCSNRRHREQGFDINHRLKLNPFDRVVSISSLRSELEPTRSAFNTLGPLGHPVPSYVLAISSPSVTSCDRGKSPITVRLNDVVPAGDRVNHKR